LRFERGKALEVHYDDVVVGNFVIDVLVEETVLVELKALQSLVAANEVQLVHYLAATNIDVGLLLNFGARSLEFKRKTRLYIKKTSDEDILL
jgi:GxxExxY protein